MPLLSANRLRDQAHPEHRPSRSQRWRARLRAARGGLQPTVSIAAALLSSALVCAQPEPDKELMRFGFSDRMFEGVNVNDARAAMKVWSQEVAVHRGIPVSSEVISFTSADALQAALHGGQVEAVAVTADEFWKIRAHVSVGPLIFSRVGEKDADEYLLLVNRDLGIKSLADLKGKTITWIQSPRSCLMIQWLEIELNEIGLGPADTYFSSIKADTKLSRVMLPVFFGKSDACLVTRNGFNLMSELNPQIAKQLVPIVVSPPLMSSLFFFRGDYESPNVDRILEIFDSENNNVSSFQIFSFFQQDRPVRGQPEQLESTMQMLDRYDEIVRERGTARTTAAPSSQP